MRDLILGTVCLILGSAIIGTCIGLAIAFPVPAITIMAVLIIISMMVG